MSVSEYLISSASKVVKNGENFKKFMEYQCYYIDENGERCKKRQPDCWCSDEHKILWQQSTYGSEKKKPTTEEMQQKLNEFAMNARTKAFTEKTGQRKLF